MKISAKSKYALFAVLVLAENYRKELPLSVHKIAEKYGIGDQCGISENFMIQILAKLKKAGMVESARGSFGGYRLNRSPERITIGEILAIMESDSKEKKQKVFSSEEEMIDRIFAEAEDQKRQYLSDITVSALLLRIENENAGDYSI
ncbi:MAG: Rrf2 family transcriptional regulator [Planctomycetia bacterium]|nr:Rrf2 family transcriptional regulator [Planctomycetia bacterium]